MTRLMIDGIDIFDSLSAMMVAETLSVPPEQVSSIIDVPGRASCQVDVSNAGGHPCWSMRDAEIALIFTGDDRDADIGRFVSAYCGKSSTLWIESDPEHYYTARLGISGIERYIDAMRVTVSAAANSFKTRPFSKTGLSGLSINGDSPMRPKVTVSSIASYTYVQMQHTQSGKLIRVNSPSGTFSSQSISKLVIDFAERHCEFIKTSNATVSADPYVTLASDYFDFMGDMGFYLYPGNQGYYAIEGDELWL